MGAYLGAYTVGDPSADIDLDWIVGVNDFVTYAGWYSGEGAALLPEGVPEGGSAHFAVGRC
jgi:hypothetical protein